MPAKVQQAVCASLSWLLLKASKSLPNAKVYFRAVLACGDIKRKADLMLLGQDEACANSAGRQEISAHLGEMLGNFTNASEPRENPAVTELPTILGLHCIHLPVPITT